VGSSLTSNSPAGVEAAQGCIHAASTWGRALRPSRGCRQSTATEQSRDSELKTQSEEALEFIGFQEQN
jgi:hypothetical protein